MAQAMPKPSLTKTHFDIPPNSVVSVWKEDGTQITGQVYANPKYTAEPSILELINVRYDRSRQADIVGTRKAHMKINESEIKHLQVLQRAENVDRDVSNPNLKVERVVQTHTITNVEQLKRYIHALQVFQVDKMALGLRGINLSRDGSLGWICILTEQMLLVCIDCKDKKRDSANREWWNTIDEEILNNDKILKIVFDVRPMIDFLFHRLSLDLVNVFDVQMTDLFQQISQKVIQTFNGTTKNVAMPEPQIFSQLVEKSKINVLPEELALLKAVEAQDYSMKHPLMNRPLTQCMEMKEVAVSLRLLLTLYKRQVDQFTAPLKECTEAQINYMKSGSFLVSYEQAVQAGNYSPDVFRLINKQLTRFYHITPAQPSCAGKQSQNVRNN